MSLAELNIGEMTDDELVLLGQTLQAEVARINLQISEAKASAASLGTPADRSWLGRAKFAAKMKGIEFQTICRELGRRRRERAAVQGQSYEREFIEQAYAMLPKPTYESIVRATHYKLGIPVKDKTV